MSNKLASQIVGLTRDRNPANELLGTLQLIHSIGAELTHAVHTGNLLNANSIALFPKLFHIICHCHHDASSFVA